MRTAQRAALPRTPQPAPTGAGIQLNSRGDLILGGVARIFSYSEIYKVVDLQSKGTSDFLHVGESDVFLCSLDHANIGAMYLGEFAKSLLRIAALHAFLAHPFAELDQYLFIHTYTYSVGSCYLWFYIL